MSIDRMGNELAALGVAARDVRCLLLLPQIYVGWAIEQRDVSALEGLLDTTVRRAQFDADTFARARSWLFERPSRAQFQSGFALLRALRRAPENPTIASSDLLEAMLWACRAAQLDGQRRAVSSLCGAVSLPVARALNELEAWLEIETAELWNDLLATESDGPVSSAPAPRFQGLSDAELERATALIEEPDDNGLRLVDRFDDEALWVELDDERVGAALDDERSEVLIRDESTAPASAPFPLLRRLA